jgi:hypothetical protein
MEQLRVTKATVVEIRADVCGVNTTGTLLIADSGNNRIRMVTR